MKRVWLLPWLLMLVLCACDSPLVGAKCRAGFTICAGVCVDEHADFRNCGACGHSCGLYLCQQGVCSKTQLRDAGADTGTSEADSGRALADAGALDSGSLDASQVGSDAAVMACGLGERDCSGQCVNPHIDPAHCGSCDNGCAVGQVCSAGVCMAQCEAPLTLCSGQCFDLTQDSDHCGSCDTRCPSGICELGVCAGAIAGQAVVIGHDFLSANNAMQRLAGNAVFLGRGAPVRVLVYRGESSSASQTGVESAIDVVKAEIGRDWQRIEAIESLVPLQLAAADVLLVHAQSNATKSTLVKLGQQWSNALSQFVGTGGVVVVFDAPSSSNDGTFRMLEPSQIFAADSRETVLSQQLTVQTPGLGVAVRVPDRYMSASDTVHFTGMSTPGSAVVVDKDGKPVIVQRVIVP
jgi:hypothetical protein